MFRIYLEDKSFYDIKLSEEMDLEYLTKFLCEGANFIFVPATCGEVCLSKSSIVKIVKL